MRSASRPPAPLPPPCPNCAPTGGIGRLVETGDGVSGVGTCDCARGQELEKAKQERADAIRKNAQKQAAKEAADKKAKRERSIRRRRADRALARKYDPPPADRVRRQMEEFQWE